MTNEVVSTNFIHKIIDEDIENGLSARIHTRFPPEPNGYPHIGHLKAIWINYSTAKKYNGLFNLRYDDTNPAKESDEFVRSIREDTRCCRSRARSLMRRQDISSGDSGRGFRGPVTSRSLTAHGMAGSW